MERKNLIQYVLNNGDEIISSQNGRIIALGCEINGNTQYSSGLLKE